MNKYPKNVMLYHLIHGDTTTSQIHLQGLFLTPSFSNISFLGWTNGAAVQAQKAKKYELKKST